MARIRSRVTKVVSKIESTVGTDASPAGTDFHRVLEESTFSLNPDVIDNPELRGGYGEGEHLVGALRPTISVVNNVRASGAAGTAPENQAMLLACGFAETIRTALPSSASTASSGTATTVVIDRSTYTDWPATDNSFIGEAVVLAGNPTTPTIDFITGYSVAGNDVTITLATTHSPVLSSSTTIQKLAQVVYHSLTPSPHPALTQYWYMDGLLQKFVGVRGSWSRTLTASRQAQDRFDLSGFNGGRTDASMLTGETDDSTSPPLWKAAICHVNRLAVCATSMNVTMNAAGFFPDCPVATEGIDPYEVTSRGFRLTIDPDLSLVATVNRLSQLTGGTIMPVAAMLGPRTGGSAGTRAGLVFPYAKLRGLGESPTNGIRKEQLEFGSTKAGDVAANAEAILTYF